MSEERLSLASCESKLGYSFRDPGLLVKALTHSSSKTAETPSNERLEFLGDAILGMIVSEFLYSSFPDYTEGQLTRIKSVVVSSRTLGKETERIGLDAHVTVGKGIAVKKSLPRSLLANVFEAVIAAIYLDGGVEPARRFVLEALRPEIEKVLQNQHHKNYKSLLQHFVQKHFNEVPAYRVRDEQGPDHFKYFQVAAVVRGVEWGTAWGRNKKDAEQLAAREALRALRSGERRAGEEGPPPPMPVPDVPLEALEPEPAAEGDDDEDPVLVSETGEPGDEA
jgi:ribonuclease-3